MKLTCWSFVCARCGNHFTAPWADLSFLYGTRLGCSSNDAWCVLSLFDDPFRELSRLVDEDPRACELDASHRLRLALDVASELLDPDPQGAPFVYGDAPPCPNCGERRASVAREQSEGGGVAAAMPAPHLTWNSWPADARRRSVQAAVERRLTVPLDPR